MARLARPNAIERRARKAVRTRKHPDTGRWLSKRALAAFKGTVTRERGKRERSRDRASRAEKAARKRAKRKGRFTTWGPLRRAREIAKRIAKVYGGGKAVPLLGVPEPAEESEDRQRPPMWGSSFAVLANPYQLPREGVSRPEPPTFTGLVKPGKWRASIRFFILLREGSEVLPEQWYSVVWSGNPEIITQEVDRNIRDLGQRPSTQDGWLLAVGCNVYRGT